MGEALRRALPGASSGKFEITHAAARFGSGTAVTDGKAREARVVIHEHHFAQFLAGHAGDLGSDVEARENRVGQFAAGFHGFGARRIAQLGITDRRSSAITGWSDRLGYERGQKAGPETEL